MSIIRTGFIAATAVAAWAASANAATVVYQDLIVPPGATQTPIVDGSVDGLQDWVGRLGMNFSVLNPVTVVALGAFDNGDITRLDGSTGSGVDVGIFNLNTGSLVGTSVHFTSSSAISQILGDAFQNVINPFLLGVGSYSIVAVNDRNYNQGYFGGPNKYQATNNVGGSISFTGPSTYDNVQSLGVPGNTDGPPVNRYDAGTFAVATPLPAAWTMMLTALGLIGFVSFRQRKQNGSIVAA